MHTYNTHVHTNVHTHAHTHNLTHTLTGTHTHVCMQYRTTAMSVAEAQLPETGGLRPPGLGASTTEFCQW